MLRTKNGTKVESVVRMKCGCTKRKGKTRRDEYSPRMVRI